VIAAAPRPQADPRAPFQAYGAALQLWGSKSEEILIEGPAGTGKTRTILEKIHFCMMKYPGSRALLVRKTRESLNESVLTTYEEKVLPVGSPLLLGPQRKFRTSYNYPNGSRIVIGGMDKPTKIMSTEFDIIGTFETTELNEEDFEN
jgi:phage terminase large subunit